MTTAIMQTCPRCQTTLSGLTRGEIRVYPCEGCGGHALTLSQLRAVTDREHFQRLWQLARGAPVAALRCPSCAAGMRTVEVLGVEIEVCLRCQLLWLDVGEQERLVGQRPALSSPSLDARRLSAAESEARRILAEEKVASMAADHAQRERAERRLGWLSVVLEVLWWWSV